MSTSKKDRDRAHLQLAPGFGSTTTAGEMVHGKGHPASDVIDEAEFLVGRPLKPRSNGSPSENKQQWFGLHEGYIAQVFRILESKKYPGYETRSDVYAHAVIRHIDFLCSLVDIEGSILAELHQIAEIVKEEQRSLIFSKSIDAVSAVIEGVLNLPGGRQEVARMLRRMQKHIEKMRPGFWKDGYSKLFFERFGPYFESESPLFVFSSDDSLATYDGDDAPFHLLESIPDFDEPTN